MNRAPSTMSIRRRPLVALAALSLLLAACADNDTVAPPTDGIGVPGGDSAGDVRTSVATMKLCELVDLEPLVATLASPNYEFGPEDIPPGSGVDPAGPQCFAQLNLPPLAGALGETTLTPARCNIAVVPYDDTAAATESFGNRITEATKPAGVESARGESAELPGDWQTGTIVTNFNDVDNQVFALVQQDDYLVKIDLQVSSDAAYKQKFPFTMDEVTKTVIETMGTLYSTVSAEVGS